MTEPENYRVYFKKNIVLNQNTCSGLIEVKDF